MPVYRLNPDDPSFPPAEDADPSGLLAVGGDLQPERLLSAYVNGIFPWYEEGSPILWHAPDPRFVLYPKKLHVPKSLRKTIKRGTYEVRFDTAFEDVIDHCAQAQRPGQHGTWITSEMRDAYIHLHALGFAHSAESWANGKLQGGLYGVALGSLFCGESMFALAPDASKVAFAVLVERLMAWGCTLIDCQAETSHLARFGAEPISRRQYMAELTQCLKVPTRRGLWTA